MSEQMQTLVSPLLIWTVNTEVKFDRWCPFWILMDARLKLLPYYSSPPSKPRDAKEWYLLIFHYGSIFSQCSPLSGCWGGSVGAQPRPAWQIPWTQPGQDPVGYEEKMFSGHSCAKLDRFLISSFRTCLISFSCIDILGAVIQNLQSRF